MSITLRSNPSNLEVLYEDNHVIAINKKPGDIVQGDKTGDIPLGEIVKKYLKKKYDKPGNVFLGIVHRLDRPTSGIVLFSKTSKALSRLNKMFAGGDAKKIYWALAKNPLERRSATLTHWLVKNPKQNKSYAHPKEVENSKKAVLTYRTLKKLDSYTLLEIDLRTGRHHQIRAQLAALGSHIKGDLKYGANRSNKDGSIHLHARNLELEHPIKYKMLQIMAPTPNDLLWNACD